MAFDPASVAQRMAALAARADDGLFPVESGATTIRSMDLGRFPAAQGLLPQKSQPAYLVAYTLLYRRILFSGGIVVAQANITIAKGILVEDASFQLALYDLRNPWNEYTPGGKGVVAGP